MPLVEGTCMFPNTLRHLRVVPEKRQQEDRTPRVNIQLTLEAVWPIEMSLEKVPRSTRLAAPIEDEHEMLEEMLFLLAMAA